VDYRDAVRVADREETKLNIDFHFDPSTATTWSGMTTGCF
jgi:hypothetical protein